MEVVVQVIGVISRSSSSLISYANNIVKKIIKLKQNLLKVTYIYQYIISKTQKSNYRAKKYIIL